MEMEQWLEEAMVVTNRALRLMPSSVFNGCLETCRREGASLEAIASAGNKVGLADRTKLLELKERNPEPCVTPPTQEEVVAFKKEHQTIVEFSRFLVSYLVSAEKEVKVALDFQPLDEEAARGFGRALESLMRQTPSSDKAEE
jgi:hypothetical protein